MKHYPKAMTLIEMIFLVAISAIALILMMPLVLNSREKSRSASCQLNLQQIASAANQYEVATGYFPASFFWSVIPGQNASEASLASGHGPLVAILPFLEKSFLYHSINFDHNIHSVVNTSVCSFQVNQFYCPSDSQIRTYSQLTDTTLVGPHPKSGKHLMAKSSYAAVAGPWVVNTWKISEMGQGERSNYQEIIRNQLGMFNISSFIKLEQVTDGTSSTLMFGEHSLEFIPFEKHNDIFWWVSGNHGDTLLSTMFPINSWKHDLLPEIIALSASSSHAISANFAFADGSVRPIRETIGTMNFKPNPKKLFDPDPAHAQLWAVPSVDPYVVGPDPFWDTIFKLRPGERFGLYQALSTRAGGEWIGSY